MGDTPGFGMNASPDRDEANINFKYAPSSVPFSGLSLQLRFAWLWEQDSCVGSDANDVREVRFVTNYVFDCF